MEVARVPENDEILVLLRSRLKRQRIELDKWGQSATPARRRQALVIAKEDFDGLCIQRLEAQQRGAEKAFTRTKERAELLTKMQETITALKEVAETAVTDLTLQHEERAKNKAN